MGHRWSHGTGWRKLLWTLSTQPRKCLVANDSGSHPWSMRKVHDGQMFVSLAPYYTPTQEVSKWCSSITQPWIGSSSCPAMPLSQSSLLRSLNCSVLPFVSRLLVIVKIEKLPWPGLLVNHAESDCPSSVSTHSLTWLVEKCKTLHKTGFHILFLLYFKMVFNSPFLTIKKYFKTIFNPLLLLSSVRGKVIDYS